VTTTVFQIVEHRNTREDVQIHFRTTGVDVVLHRHAHRNVVVRGDIGHDARASVGQSQRTGDEGQSLTVQQQVERT
jgi:hypothetical protein